MQLSAPAELDAPGRRGSEPGRGAGAQSRVLRALRPGRPGPSAAADPRAPAGRGARRAAGGSPAGQNYEKNKADSDNITLLAIALFWPPKTWGSLFERAAYQLEKLHKLARHSELTVITNKQNMRNFVERRERGEQVLAGIYLIEGAHPLEGKLENLDLLFDRGLRIIGLTHFFDNELGGSLHGISGEGLTAFGRSAIRRANELGLIVDVAHASPKMVSDVLALATSPVIVSHAGVKGTCDSARNLDDALMVEIANRGGLVGIGYWEGAVCDVTPAGVVNAIRYAIDLLGVRHVALGSDYDGATSVMFDAGEIAVLTGEMLRADFTEQEIRMVMGENVKRFLLENLPDGDDSGVREISITRLIVFK